jgi:hypothetical protein
MSTRTRYTTADRTRENHENLCSGFHQIENTEKWQNQNRRKKKTGKEKEEIVNKLLRFSA